MTLDEAIEQVLADGVSDPLEGARRILDRNDSHWTKTVLFELSEELISERFRKQMGSTRRGVEKALATGDSGSQTAIRQTRSWVPGVGWKLATSLTRSDLLARADWYTKAGLACLRRAQWCRDVADRMEAEGVAQLGDLVGKIPAIPDEEHLELTG